MDEFLLTGHITKTSDNDVDSDVDANVLPIAQRNTMVDKLTMEYMMNRNHYKKFLKKTDVNRFQETQEKIQFVKANYKFLLEIVESQLSDFIQHGSFTKYNNQVNGSFEKFMNDCIGYFQENPPDQNNDKFVDILFSEPKKKTSRK